MEKHEHTVSLHYYDDGGGRLYKASDVDRNGGYCSADDQRFHFCPECGASLGSFWTDIEAQIAAYRREIDRREADRVAYKQTPPT